MLQSYIENADKHYYAYYIFIFNYGILIYIVPTLKI